MALITTPELEPAPGRAPRRIAFRQRIGRWDVKASPYLYISPFFILFAIVGLFPLGYTAWVSLHDWNLIGGKGDFVGLDNFANVLAVTPAAPGPVPRAIGIMLSRNARWSSRLTAPP